MPKVDNTKDKNLHTLTSEIIVAYVHGNQITAEQLPNLVREVHKALSTLGTRTVSSDVADIYATSAADSVAKTQLSPPTNPAVPIADSVTPNHIICLEDGQKMKTLKRHLNSAHGLTPSGYRRRWGLSPNYPMVAQNYSATRKKIAARSGLGRKARQNIPPLPGV